MTPHLTDCHAADVIPAKSAGKDLPRQVSPIPHGMPMHEGRFTGSVPKAEEFVGENPFRRCSKMESPKLPVAEVFCSLQGEGFLTGTESVFVRVSGCNLRCWFCDTRYASWEPEGESRLIEEVLEEVSGFRPKHVVLTGGEPMLFPAVVPLTLALKERGYHITIETAGTKFLPVICDLMSISPKLSNSTPSREKFPGLAELHERRRYAPDVIRQLISQFPYQIKFVIETPEDLKEVEEYLQAFPELDRSRVMLMPQGTDVATLNAKAVWLEPYCRQRGYHFCPRRHIEWFGPGRGK
jgi:7-carboxy-7-deazaguanine synthase